MQDDTASSRHGSPVIARQLRVDGRVQGVSFRASLRELAERCGVTGWVANRPDGRVEAWLEGSPGDVEAVVTWVARGGPPAANVVEVRVQEVDERGWDRFEIRG